MTLQSFSMLTRYAGKSGFVHSRNEFLPEVVALIEQRAKRDDFNGAGVLVAIVKKSDGSYLVRTTVQYNLGGQQYVSSSVSWPTLRQALKIAYRQIRVDFPRVVERKFAVDLIGNGL